MNVEEELIHLKEEIMERTSSMKAKSLNLNSFLEPKGIGVFFLIIDILSTYYSIKLKHYIIVFQLS